MLFMFCIVVIMVELLIFGGLFSISVWIGLLILVSVRYSIYSVILMVIVGLI